MTIFKFCLYITLLLVQSYFDLISCVQQHCLFNFLKNIFILWIEIDILHILHTKGIIKDFFFGGGGVFLNQRFDEFQCELSFSGEKSILSTLNLNNYTSLYKRLGKVKPCVGLTIPRRLFWHSLFVIMATRFVIDLSQVNEKHTSTCLNLSSPHTSDKLPYDCLVFPEQ